MKLTKGLKWVIGIYTVLMVADIMTTLMNYDIAIYLETNPLYRLFGSFTVLILYNVAVLAAFIWAYSKFSAFVRYTIITAVCWVGLARVSAIINAIRIYCNPPTIAVAQAVGEATKATQYNYMVLFVMLIPFSVCWVIYWIFSSDYEFLEK